MPSSPNYKRDKRAGRTIPKTTKRVCPECSEEFLTVPQGKFCSEECKGKFKYTSKRCTSDKQYQYISGNWSKYLSRLLNAKPERASLSVEDLLSKLEEQSYLCALTGVELTCTLKAGTIFKTNASIDRLEAGGPYIASNIQLVCSAVNSFRGSLSVSEFIWWCRKVTENAK